MGLDSKIKSGLGEMNHADWVVVQLRCPGASFDGEPDFEGVFRGQFMVPKSGRETENAKRNPLGNLQDGLIGRDVGVFGPVQTATNTFDLSGLGKIPEVRSGHREACELFRAHEGPFLDNGSDMFRLFAH